MEPPQATAQLHSKGLTPLLYSPIGLDPKLAKRALNDPQEPLNMVIRATRMVPRVPLYGISRARFARFRSSPLGLYSKEEILYITW